MTSPRPAPVSPARAPGFVLVGVVMFVLALTILGISLFSLSSYEAQFFGRSSDGSQAFYAASGGIEWARFVLLSQKTLESVSPTHNTYPAGVIYARARYTDGIQDSTGPIDFTSGRPISIRVMAEIRGEREMIQSVFRPNSDFDCYKRLLTAFHGMNFDGLPADQGRSFVVGDAMQNGTDTLSWAAAGTRPRYLAHADSVPLPAVAAFLAAHIDDANTQDIGVQISPYNLHALPGGYKFFRTKAPFLAPNSFVDGVNTTPTIDVKGTAIWMLDKGMRFNNHVTVTGPATACLIIVAQDGVFLPGGEHAGMYFLAGIDSDNVPVFLVTDSIVRDEQFANNTGGVTELKYVSIFADQVSIIGPLTGGSMTLRHDMSSTNDQPGGLIDVLYSQGLLPNSSGGRGFTQLHGQWAELDPSNPPN